MVSCSGRGVSWEKEQSELGRYLRKDRDEFETNFSDLASLVLSRIVEVLFEELLKLQRFPHSSELVKKGSVRMFQTLK